MNLEDIETFTVHWHSKALVDGFFRDWIAKGTYQPGELNTQNVMTMWPGVSLLPDQLLLGNLQVLWAQPEFMILYRCTPKYNFDLQGKEQVLILTRDNPRVTQDGFEYSVLPENLQRGIEAKFADLFQDEISDGSKPLIFQRDMMKTNQLDNCDDNLDLELPSGTKWTEPIYSKARTLVIAPHLRYYRPLYRYTIPGMVPDQSAGRSGAKNKGEEPTPAKDFSQEEMEA